MAKKILYYDCFAGISGDMNLSAMLTLGKKGGLTANLLRTELSKLHLDNQFQLLIEPAKQYEISGLRCIVKTAHSSSHRRLHDIYEIIDKSSLELDIKKSAKIIFKKIAKVEAEVHGTKLEEVHFHEIGAVDSIIDIVGAAICHYHLKIQENIETVWSSSIELGGGYVQCSHGTMPVPAPATALLSQDIPTKRGAVEKEATTPTGAAIISHFTNHFTNKPEMTITKTGYGIGHRDNGTGQIVNVLRLHLAKIEKNYETFCNTVLLQCNIDDMTAEALGFTLNKMMKAGAMDCYFTPIIMKKGRPATSLSLLCSQEKEAYFAELLFRHTTTLGLKSFSVKKHELVRRSRKIATPLGDITIKEALFAGAVIRSKPEYDECCQMAEQYNKPITEIYDIIAQSNEK